ncbi:glycoside hydrolase family 127 protein [Demequina sp. SO4-18]|uniref:glycoside hydrolase family 127 protein n=1 Tax=Demequina sp. SO4-18 TaxID=3401026 RepID=UPI003B5AF94B
MTNEVHTTALPVQPSRGALRPIGMADAVIADGFWAQLQSLNASAMIRHCEDWMERLGWIGNFDAAVEGRLPEARRGREFSDSDVFKLMEAMAWEIGRTGDEDLDARFEALVDRILPVQEEDGYLNTRFGRPGQQPRYSNFEWGHELYCFGHLFQAAVARARTTGHDRFVAMACRAADHVCDTFGEGGLQAVGGHAEIEPALVELGRLTGEQRYLDQARLFVHRRGHGLLEDIEFGRAYYQDDEPIHESTVLRGHAVRATYLAAGAVDVAIESGDDLLLGAVQQQMATTLARRTYITGGMGAHHEGESFGSDFELPSDRAYAETCAGIGSIMANYRLLLATGDVRYADVIERTLFNVLATSPGEDGRSFFYANTLHQREPGVVPEPDAVSPRAAASMRAPWFAVSCCPTNVARTVASLSSYFAASTVDALHIYQYATGSVRAELDAGPVAVDVETDYPDGGEVAFTVTETLDTPWTLAMRVPAWAEGATLTVAGAAERVNPGLATVTESFEVGDTVVLSLPMRTRMTLPDVRMDALRGQVAFERGPLVLCVESVDVPSIDVVDQLRVAGGIRDEGATQVTVGMRTIALPDRAWPFESGNAASASADTVDVPLRPYHQWGNRGSSTMRVWIPLDADVATEAP